MSAAEPITMSSRSVALGAESLKRLRVHLRPTCRARFDPEPRLLRGTPFAMSNDELRFAFGLLDGPSQAGLRKHNLWLFRPDQTCRAGDFVVVDVSAPPRGVMPSWEVFVLEVKMSAPLRLGGGCVGLQLQHAQAAAQLAVLEAARAHRAVRGSLRGLAPSRVTTLVGSREALLEFFA